MTGKDRSPGSSAGDDKRVAGKDDEPALPKTAREDRDEGWGEDPRDRRRDLDWYRRERPPHHE